MHVLNAMLGKKLGGIEQAFIDYCRALDGQGNKVTALLHPQAMIKRFLVPYIDGSRIEIKEIGNWGQWDKLSVIKIRALIKQSNPDVIIAHGLRAAGLLRQAAKGLCPIVGVTHNYKNKKLMNLNALFSITKELLDLVIASGQKKGTVYHIPNMIDVHASARITPRTYRKPLVIGAMGRFVEKKGFPDFILAVELLNKRGLDSQVMLAGSGEDEVKLKELVAEKGLSKIVNFLGWIENKDDFYNAIDIFCLPSWSEPFGIVLIEAFARGIPTVTTNIEGPAEIATNRHDALMVPKKNPAQMAAALEELMADHGLADRLADNAVNTVRERYQISTVGKKMHSALQEIIEHYRQAG